MSSILTNNSAMVALQTLKSVNKSKTETQSQISTGKRVSSAKDKSQLWGFIQRYAPEATPEANPGMDAAAGHAVRYYNDFVKPAKVFRAPTDLEREALEDLRARLQGWDGGLDAEALQSMVFAVGKERFDPLRDWFTALYEVLLGASQGPRFGGFIALYGVDETIALIDEALAGNLAAA